MCFLYVVVLSSDHNWSEYIWLLVQIPLIKCKNLPNPRVVAFSARRPQRVLTIAACKERYSNIGQFAPHPSFPGPLTIRIPIYYWRQKRPFRRGRGFRMGSKTAVCVSARARVCVCMCERERECVKYFDLPKIGSIYL